ncbi:HEAT repeat domain-containing protein [Vulgatibacter sp.]|uniref:HEAT repeat domain-containing protein n=1 Tax=Vulgatibacter sp. TaxID=1971226 RepID=UPI00356AEDEA
MNTSGLSQGEQERIAAIDRIVASESDPVGPLLERLDEKSWAVRRAVVAALASLGDAAVPPLCNLLRSSRDDEARIAAAVDALVASVGDADRCVAGLAGDPNPAVAADAAQILGRRRSRSEVPTLVQLIDHEDDNVAVAAIEALGRIGGRAAVDSLIRAVGSGNFFRVFPAVDVLGRSGDPRAVAPLAGLAENPVYGSEAVRSLGRTGERQAVAPLAALICKRSDAAVRLGAVALAELAQRHYERYGDPAVIDDAVRLATPAAPATRRLAQVLPEAESGEQVAICRLLGVLGGEHAVAALTQQLDAPSPVSEAAAAALKRLGRESDQPLLLALREGDSARRRVLLPLVSRATAADEVVRCLGDPDATVRALAADALARLGNPALVPALFPLLADENPRVAQAAAGAIQSLGSPLTEKLALEAARSGEARVRRAALRILGYFGYASALPVFEAALRDPDPRLREAALQGLAYIDEPRALEALLEAARDEEDRTRALAMRSLGQVTEDLRVTSYLLRGLADRDPWVRYYACQALGRQGVEVAARPIAERLDDDAGQVRVAAVDALSHLQTPLASEALRRAARSADPDVCRAALIGLGIRRERDALGILLERSRDTDAATRLVAISAMADFSGDEVEEALATAARDEEESVRTAAVGFLAARPGKSATLRLVGMAGVAPVRELVDAGLSVPVEGRVEGIVEALADADDELAPRLVSALLRMRLPDAGALLRRVAGLPNAPARKAAMGALASIGEREVLQTAAASDVDPEVRRIATLLLSD